MRSKNVHWKVRDMKRRHWESIGKSFGIFAPDGRPVGAVINDLIERTPRVIQVVSAQLPSNFPPDLADSILEGLRAASQRLAQSD